MTEDEGDMAENAPSPTVFPTIHGIRMLCALTDRLIVRVFL